MKIDLKPYTGSNIAICLGDETSTKMGALYFDLIIPISFTSVPQRVVPIQVVTELQTQGLPSPIRKDRSKIRYSNTFEDDKPNSELMLEIFIDAGKKMYFPTYEKDSREWDMHLASCFMEDEEGFRTSLNALFRKTGLQHLPVLMPADLRISESASVEDVTFEIANIPLVDVRKLEWKQILELRKDKDSIRKLRRMRLFLHDNYRGESRRYVEDHILKMLDDYEQTAKRHGLELVTGVLSAIFDSKSLLLFGALSVVGAILGSPTAAGASALVGSIAEIGKITLTVVNKKYEFSKLKNDHPLAYLIQLRDIAK
jgi:hypothetical protein